MLMVVTKSEKCDVTAQLWWSTYKCRKHSPVHGPTCSTAFSTHCSFFTHSSLVMQEFASFGRD